MIKIPMIYGVKGYFARKRLRDYIEILFTDKSTRKEVINGLGKYYKMEEEFRREFPKIEIKKIRKLVDILEEAHSQDTRR